MTWMLLFIALFFFMGPFRGRWRGGRWRGRPWNRDTDFDRNTNRGNSGQKETGDRQREEQLNLLETRVAELESRLDYAERLLSQRREPESIVAS